MALARASRAVISRPINHEPRPFLLDHKLALNRRISRILRKSAHAHPVGGWTFGSVAALRHNAPALRYPGAAKKSRTFQYPHAIEHHGSLWVIYSTNKEDIEISEFALEDLQRAARK